MIIIDEKKIDEIIKERKPVSVALNGPDGLLPKVQELALKISKKFDLIILSHSLMYINEIKKTFIFLKSKLNNNGSIFVQLPNLKKNPLYLLMGDQYRFFTKNSLINMLTIFGFDSKIINSKFFSRELLIQCKLRKNNFNQQLLRDKTFNILTNNINIFLKKIYKLDSKYYVFGSTINAAIVDEILKEKIIGFVDESNFRKNKKFRDKLVINPLNLPSNSICIIPYGKDMINVLIRFKNVYQKKYTRIWFD